MTRAQTTTRADASTQCKSPQMDKDASLNDYWAEVLNRQWDMERYAEFQWLCKLTQMPCVSGNQWLQVGRYRQHVWMRLLGSMDKASSVACAEHPPRSSGFLEEHFTLSVATRTAKTEKDWKGKYCDYLGRAWDDPARGKAHLAGQARCGVAA